MAPPYDYNIFILLNPDFADYAQNQRSNNLKNNYYACAIKIKKRNYFVKIILLNFNESSPKLTKRPTLHLVTAR